MLLSGDHARIAAWRHDQAVRRTADRRPDLLHPSRVARRSTGTRLDVRTATPADAGELLTLQLRLLGHGGAGQPDAGHPAAGRGPRRRAGLAGDVDHARACAPPARLVGAVRGRLDGDVWHIGRLMVAPDLRGRGLGPLAAGARRGRRAAGGAPVLAVHRRRRASDNLRMYKRAGYRRDREQPEDPGVVRLGKPLRRR